MELFLQVRELIIYEYGAYTGASTLGYTGAYTGASALAVYKILLGHDILYFKVN